MMFKTILAAYDGSPPARACAATAATCAARWDAQLILCYALDVERLLIPAAGDPGSAFDMIGSFRHDAQNLLAGQAQECRASGADCKTVLCDEAPVAGILKTAAESKADLLAIGTHGASGIERALLGSVAEAVLRHSVVPVLAVRAAFEGAAFKDIVVAMDESGCAALGLNLAAEIARAEHATLHLLHVVPHGASREASMRGIDSLGVSAKRIRERGVTAFTFDECGDPGTAICAFAERLGAHLVVVGSHGRTGIARALLGSVAEEVLRHAPCPVLIAKEA